ncbi:hypothetical protein ACWCQK_22125 [Streptomyces sp. NPDC002306]
MSRETDTPSSGPDGRGGAAYPSGTPPYGTPMVSDGGTGAGRSAAQPEERKTETTLTTRIRINIPGSRPIPPVVVRTPVADSDSGTGEDTGAAAPAPAAVPTGAVEPPADPAAPAEEKTSDWFAPRKGGSGKGGGSTNGAGLPGGAAAGAAGAGPGAPAGAPAAAPPNAGRPGGVAGTAGPAGGSRPGGTNGAGLSGATGGPVAPGHGGGTGSFDVTEALAAGPLGNGSRPGSGDTRRDDLPYFAENGQGAQSGQGGQSGYGGPPSVPGGQGGAQGPSGPTGGPVTGDGPLVPPVGGAQGGLGARRVPGASGAPGGPGAPGAPGAPGGPQAFSGGESFSDPGMPGGPRGRGPGGPGTAPGRGPAAAGGGPGGLSDDTAILTPQKPAPEPGPGGYGGRMDNVSGQTVTSGMPIVPPGVAGAPGAPFGSGARPDGPLPHTPPKLPEPVAQNVPPAAPRKKKKGRSKLVLLGSLVVVGAAGAYGAGLLMNHSDVPKGTTVLGVDIGGGTRDEAVKKLDEAFGERVGQPLKLSVDGDTVTLKPDQAGLQLDEQATVAAAAQSDYNPVSVIGSLFGGQREIEPVMPVDEEKLQAALQSAAGGSGSASDGTIKFQSGKAVAVYGKAGKGIDVAQSNTAVAQAYRTQVETGAPATVKVPTTTRQPTIPDAEVDRMMKKFAEPAMSAKVTVQTDAAHSVPFSPQNSLWKFLEVKAIDGKLVESYNEAALKELYGHTFDGVLITRGTGQKTAVTVQDVISALRPALTSTTNRVGVIETNPS